MENKNKFNAFKAVPLSDWEIVAREELNGANPWEKLAHQGNGWSILPFYYKNEGVHSPALLSASENNFLGPRTWYNCPTVQEKDAKNANEMALEYLKEGADGIFFELTEETNVEVLLKGIEWQYCSLNFLVKKNHESIAASLLDFINQKKNKNKPLPGAFFGNLSSYSAKIPFRMAGFYWSPSPSPVDEITDGFNLMLDRLGKNFINSTSQVAFSTSLDTDFFLDIAKLRAIRVIWAKILERVRVNSAPPLFIHGRSLPWTNKNYEPHENMLKSTTACMAAILGGCDTVTIEPENSRQPMMARQVRNVSNILREESHFSKVADPVAGSYFVEDLTRQIAESSWKAIEPNLPI